MINNFIQITYKNRNFIINKEDSLNSLLTQGELLALPMSIWKTLFEQKDGVCYFNLMIKVLLAKIEAYDKSSNVNGFYYNDKEYWLDKATRVGLLNLANCSSENMSLVLGNEIILLSTDKVKEFLSLLEVYAGKCFISTTLHLLNIKELRTVEDIVNYDYTLGYPDKIALNG